jgi:hypothetical protein
MTDIEKMIKEIKSFNKKLKYEELESHLVFMCHPDTKKIINTALQEAGITIDDNYIHIYESNYYTPGDVYMVTDNKYKKKILNQHGIEIKAMYSYKISYRYDDSYNINYVTYSNENDYYTWN